MMKDSLDVERTMIANERTFLAYIRTSLAMSAVGGTLIHFFSETSVRVLGVFFIVAAICMLGIGFHRFEKMRNTISPAKEPNPKIERSALID